MISQIGNLMVSQIGKLKISPKGKLRINRTDNFKVSKIRHNFKSSQTQDNFKVSQIRDKQTDSDSQIKTSTLIGDNLISQTPFYAQDVGDKIILGPTVKPINI